MSKRRGKGHPFVMLPWEILNSRAFAELTPSAVKALIFFVGKEKRVLNGGSGHAEFSFTYAEAERLGFARRTFSRIIAELIDKGFIEMAGYGGLRGYCKSDNQFRGSDRWRTYGTADFKPMPRYLAELPEGPTRARRPPREPLRKAVPDG